jgi:hypothetical protein
MLAESLFSESAVAWLVFVFLMLTSVGALPIAARAIRKRLPPVHREPIALEPVSFGDSPRARRSPRHAIRAHRTLLTTFLLSLLALVLLPGIASLRAVGPAGLEVAIALVLPTLLVAFHARRRDRPR